MKVLSPQQIRDADAFTIKNEPIASIDLMERACKAFVSEFQKSINTDSPVWVVCGTGNNGGDGLGIARMLIEQGVQVEVWLSGYHENGSPDFKANLERLHTLQKTRDAATISTEKAPKNLVVVDALFGSGLSRPLEGQAVELVAFLNGLDCQRVAVDIPSGLFCDKPQNGFPAFKAHLTISFQAPKLAFLLPENYPYAGRWKIVDIGLSADYLAGVDTAYYYQKEGDADLLVPRRPVFAHKGDAGRVLLVSGSKGKVGAAILAASACMRAGAGLLTVHTPGCAVIPLHSSVPEAMVEEDPHYDFVTHLSPEGLQAYDTVAIGPGIGTHAATAGALANLLKAVSSPVVMDADALNIISQNKALLASIPPNSVLTPHPGEFRRLVGSWANDYERLEKQIEFSKTHQLIVVLKGAFTSISTPAGEVFFNSTGNPGMATAGSGDVLTGMVSGFLSQGFSPIKSTRIAVFCHGLSGDLACERTGEYSLVASDIIDSLPIALRKMQQS